MTMNIPSETHSPAQPEVGRTVAQECAAIEADLERLKKLVNDAAGRLLIGSAITALQFQDMATQLTGHAQRRLSALEECLRTLYAEVPVGGVSAGILIQQSQPVRQAEMSAGSVDLF